MSSGPAFDAVSAWAPPPASRLLTLFSRLQEYTLTFLNLKDFASVVESCKSLGAVARSAVIAVCRKGAVDDCSARARFRMGLCFQHVLNEPKSAFDAFKQAAEAKEADAGAMFRLALCFERGIGTKHDIKAADEWLERSATAGHLDAQTYRVLRKSDNLELELQTLRPELLQCVSAAGVRNWSVPRMLARALLHEIGAFGLPERDEAFSWTQRAATSGDARALHMLARCYDLSIGVEEDKREAVRLFERSAGLGFARAMYAFAMRLEAGEGVPVDESRAVQLFREAAQLGFVAAHLAMALWHHHRGQYPEAIEHYEVAAAQHNITALFNLGQLYLHGRRVKQDVPKAVSLLTTAADLGDGDSQWVLGKLYDKGKLVPRDSERACGYVRDAARSDGRSQRDAMYWLGWAYDEGRGVARNAQQSVLWYRRAADRGHAIAMDRLAAALEVGEGVEQDQLQAAELYRKAAEIGSPPGALHLGELYLEGACGLPKDAALGRQWVEKAAAGGYNPAKELLSKL